MLNIGILAEQDYQYFPDKVLMYHGPKAWIKVTFSDPPHAQGHKRSPKVFLLGDKGFQVYLNSTNEQGNIVGWLNDGKIGSKYLEINQS